MKVIDLLNKIAKGENVPKKIKYFYQVYELSERERNFYNYKDNKGKYFDDEWYLTNILNDEIEIIEDTSKEDKKIAKIGKLNQVSNKKQDLNNYILRNKINEIIDKLNGDKYEDSN